MKIAFLFSLKDIINMLGFLTLVIVKGGITRDAFTQKVAATGLPREASQEGAHLNPPLRCRATSCCFSALQKEV